jgi:hypothetical protein
MSARLPRVAHKEGERHSIHTEHIQPLCRNIIIIIIIIIVTDGEENLLFWGGGAGSLK